MITLKRHMCSLAQSSMSRQTDNIEHQQQEANHVLVNVQ